MVGEPFTERERNGVMVDERTEPPTYDELALAVLAFLRTWMDTEVDARFRATVALLNLGRRLEGLE